MTPLPTTARRDGLALFGVGLVVNACVAWFIATPGYMDAYYYFGGALQLARGRGFTEPYLWNYLTPLSALPAPSHLYWMPLTSIVAAPFIALAEIIAGGPLPNPVLFRVAQIPFVVLASLLPLLTYAVAAQIFTQRRQIIAASLLTLFSAYYVVFWTTTDSFALFGVLAASALLIAATRTEARWLFLAGALAGLAHLTRADGGLVLIVLIAHRFSLFSPRSFVIRHSSFVILGYLLPLAPWFFRNLLVIGSPLAAGGGRALWLLSYDELFTLKPETLTAARYLAQGWGALLAGKESALVLNAGTVMGAWCSIVTFPFAVIGFWKLRRHPVIAPALVYGALLFGMLTFLFTFPGARGGLFHSGAALLPFVAPAAVMGVEASVAAMARRLPHWRPEKATPVFTALLVMLALGLTALLVTLRAPAFAHADAVYTDLGQWFTDICRRDECRAPIVAVNDPPGFYFHTGHAAIVIPNGGPEDALEAMRRFGARWLVLDVNRPAGLAALYAAPKSDPRFTLRAMLGTMSQPVYLLEVAP